MEACRPKTGSMRFDRAPTFDRHRQLYTRASMASRGKTLRPETLDNLKRRRTGHFWEGVGSILPEKYGAAPEKWMRHPKMLGFRALYFAVAYGIFSYFSFIIFKMSFFIFRPLPEKLLDCPKKNYFARLCPPAHTPMTWNLCIISLCRRWYNDTVSIIIIVSSSSSSDWRL